MSLDDDLIRSELARAWRDQAAPLPEEELGEADVATRATVAWMQGAWSTLPTPETPPAPARVTRLGRPPFGRLAVAAALLIAATFGAWHLLERRGQVPTPELPRVETRSPRTLAATIRDDGVELRSGPVRLLILADQTDSSPNNDINSDKD